MSNIDLSTRFTADDLDTLENGIRQHGNAVRGGAHVTFGDVVNLLQQARNEREAEARRQQEAQEQAAQEQAQQEPAQESLGLDRSTTLSDAQVRALIQAAVAGDDVTVGELIDAVTSA